MLGRSSHPSWVLLDSQGRLKAVFLNSASAETHRVFHLLPGEFVVRSRLSWTTPTRTDAHDASYFTD